MRLVSHVLVALLAAAQAAVVIRNVTVIPMTVELTAAVGYV
jgi:hypothetical protein